MVLFFLALYSYFTLFVTIMTCFCAVPRCRFNRREASRSAQRSTLVSEASEPSCLEDITSAPSDEAGPVIDALIVSSISPLSRAKCTEEAAWLDGSGGRGSSDRTLTGSATEQAHTPTSPPTPLLTDQLGPDKREVPNELRARL